MCQQLGLCKKALDVGEMLANVDIMMDRVDENGDRPYCALCEYAIGEVDKMITDKHNEEEIKDVLDRVCYELT